MILYKSLFLNNTSPFFVSLTICNGISLRSVLGLPSLLVIGTVVGICFILNWIVFIQLDPDEGLSDDVNFDIFFLIVPVGVPSSVSPVSSSLQYTAYDEKLFLFYQYIFQKYCCYQTVLPRQSLTRANHKKWLPSLDINSSLVRNFLSIPIHIQTDLNHFIPFIILITRLLVLSLFP